MGHREAEAAGKKIGAVRTANKIHRNRTGKPKKKKKKKLLSRKLDQTKKQRPSDNKQN
jgi:hypothetical protein